MCQYIREFSPYCFDETVEGVTWKWRKEKENLIDGHIGKKILASDFVIYVIFKGCVLR